MISRVHGREQVGGAVWQACCGPTPAPTQCSPVRDKAPVCPRISTCLEQVLSGTLGRGRNTCPAAGRAKRRPARIDLAPIRSTRVQPPGDRGGETSALAPRPPVRCRGTTQSTAGLGDRSRVGRKVPRMSWRRAPWPNAVTDSNAHVGCVHLWTSAMLALWPTCANNDYTVLRHRSRLNSAENRRYNRKSQSDAKHNHRRRGGATSPSYR